MNETSTRGWAVIKNPTSGFRSMHRFWEGTAENLEKAGIEFTLFDTEFAGHAIEMTRKLLMQGYRQLLVVGGDGTLNEVVNGIMTTEGIDSREVLLALLPQGTGNDWGRYWGMMRGKTDMVKIIREGREVTVDVALLSFSEGGRTHSRYYINGLGVGLDAKVCFYTNKLKDIFGGHHWLYTFALLFSIFTHRIRVCTVSDSQGREVTLPLFTAAVGNGCYAGGGLKQTDANPMDGLLSATVIKKLKFLDIFKGLSALFAKRLWEAPFCEPFLTEKLHIHTERSLLFELDGVMVDAREITRQTGREVTDYDIEIVPSRIRMMVP